MAEYLEISLPVFLYINEHMEYIIQRILLVTVIHFTMKHENRLFFLIRFLKNDQFLDFGILMVFNFGTMMLSYDLFFFFFIYIL